MSMDTYVSHAGSEVDGNSSNTTNEYGCSLWAYGSENLITSGRLSPGPRQAASAEEILTFHDLCHSGNSAVTGEPAKLKTVAMRPVSLCRKSNRTESPN